ncbi:MAG TPA: hypothetical protein VH280_19455 [Verrucomicrobiae bacterium]|jgi:acyl carrier protein|nr:hypothetical protein [Verrucomicrobiae bacterium]
MIEKQQIELAICNAMERVNEVLLDENALPCGDDTVLLGQGAQLDSMGFVNFIIALEEELAEKIGLVLNVTEELNSKSGSVPHTMTAGDLATFLTCCADESKLAGRADSHGVNSL